MGAILQTLRERAALTVIEAAERIGVTRTIVYAWERGDKAPDPENLTKACDVYGASPGERMRLAHLRAFGSEPTEAVSA